MRTTHELVTLLFGKNGVWWKIFVVSLSMNLHANCANKDHLAKILDKVIYLVETIELLHANNLSWFAELIRN